MLTKRALNGTIQANTAMLYAVKRLLRKFTGNDMNEQILSPASKAVRLSVLPGLAAP
jgi:hypothetical protein